MESSLTIHDTFMTLELQSKHLLARETTWQITVEFQSTLEQLHHKLSELVDDSSQGSSSVTTWSKVYCFCAEMWLVFGSVAKSREAGQAAIRWNGQRLDSEIPESSYSIQRTKQVLRQTLAFDRLIRRCGRACFVPTLTRAASNRFLSEIDQALILAPHSLEALLLKSMLLLKSCQWTQVQQLLSSHRATFFHHPLTLVYARSFHSPECAQQVLEQALVNNPTLDDLTQERSRVRTWGRLMTEASKWCHSGHFEKGTVLYTRALECLDDEQYNHGRAQVLQSRSAARLSLGQLDLAIVDLKQALAFDPENLEIQTRLDRALRHELDERQSRVCYREHRSNNARSNPSAKISGVLFDDTPHGQAPLDHMAELKRTVYRQREAKGLKNPTPKAPRARRHRAIPPGLLEILELPPEEERTSTIPDIKRAYKKLALRYHPDRNTSADAEETFKDIGAAYAALMNLSNVAESWPSTWRSILADLGLGQSTCNWSLWGFWI